MSGGKHTAEPVAFRYHIEGCFIYWYREEIIENPTEAPWVITPLYTQAENPAAFREVFDELVRALERTEDLLEHGLANGRSVDAVRDLNAATLAKAKELQQ